MFATDSLLDGIELASTEEMRKAMKKVRKEVRSGKIKKRREN